MNTEKQQEYKGKTTGRKQENNKDNVKTTGTEQKDNRKKIYAKNK